MSDHTILVTGAAGFIGFHVARRLMAEGRSVIGLDNLNSYYDPALKQARLEILRGERAFASCRSISPIAPQWRACSQNIALRRWSI